jgi:DNA-binding MarR family transcriptional regulator
VTGPPPPSAGHGPLAALLLDAAEALNAELVAELEARGWPRLTRHRSLVFRHLGAGVRRPAALAAALDITRQSMQQLLEGLEADGLVVRHPDPEDARAQQVALTARGRELVTEAGAILASTEQRLAAAMGADAIERLRDLSAQLLTAQQARRP